MITAGGNVIDMELAALRVEQYIRDKYFRVDKMDAPGRAFDIVQLVMSCETEPVRDVV